MTKSLIQGLVLTVILGAIFTLFQAYEYMHATFKMSSGIYGATFYMATGFHGFHVLVGTLFLLVCYSELEQGIINQIIILVLKQQLGTGISWMSFGYFCSQQFIFGAAKIL